MMSISSWLFRLALRAFPARTRVEIGAEALAAFRAAASTRRARAGRVAAWWYSARAIADVAVAGWRERRADARASGVRRRDARRASLVAGLVEDVRHAWRVYARRPVVAAVVVTVVALGIAGTTAVYSVVDGVLLRPLPWLEPERVVWLRVESNGRQIGRSNPLDVADWRAMATSFSEVAAYQEYSMTLQTETPLRVSVVDVSEGFGRTIGVRALHGRLLEAEDYGPGAPRRVAVSYEVWRDHLGGDPSAVGRSIVLDNRPYEVVGVLPDLPVRFPLDRPGVWTAMQLPDPGTDSEVSRSGVWLNTLARLGPGVMLEEASAEMRQIAAVLGERHPTTNAGRTVGVVPARELIIGPARPLILLLAVSVGLVLIVAAASAGNMLLAVAHDRLRELAVRGALGAGRGRLARQMVAESMFLTTIGAAIGFLLAPALMDALLLLYPGGLPRAAEVSINPTVMLVSTAAMVIATFGAALPGLRQMRRVDLQSTLRSGGRTGATLSEQRFRSALVVAQVATSVVLLFAGGILLRSFAHLQRADVGFETENLVAFNIALSATRYPEGAPDEAVMHAAMLERIRALPGVREAGTSTLLPFSPGDFIDGFTRPGHPEDAPPDLPTARLHNITPGFIEALGLRVVRGRGITPTDRVGARHVVLVNEELERRWFPDGAVGRRMELRGEVREIVGVVSDGLHDDLREPPAPDVFVPKAQSDWPRLLAWVVVRTNIDSDVLLPAIREILGELDPTVAIDDVRTMEARLASTLAPDRFRALCVGALAAVAMLLAVGGLWGVVGYSVARRTREIAIRMALGQSRRSALCDVLARAIGIAGLGTFIGAAVCLSCAGLLQGFVAGLPPRDVPTLVVVCTAILGTAVLASVGPARRASSIEPAAAMHGD